MNAIHVDLIINEIVSTYMSDFELIIWMGKLLIPGAYIFTIMNLACRRNVNELLTGDSVTSVCGLTQWDQE